MGEIGRAISRVRYGFADRQPAQGQASSPRWARPQGLGIIQAYTCGLP
jgi:hypothetical protein